jgi:hypothetical protein
LSSAASWTPAGCKKIAAIVRKEREERNDWQMLGEIADGIVEKLQ